MQRIPTADGRFLAGNPQTGVPGTIVTSKFMNDIQDEICNVIVSAGLELNGEKQTQLYEAIQRILADAAAVDASNTKKGILRLATEMETQAGSGGDIAVPPGELAKLFPIRGMQMYNMPGTFSWTVPAGVTKILISGCGGGGGGGGSGGGSSTNRSGGAGGGGAGKAQLPTLRSVTPGTTLSITIGAGGNGGARGSSGSGNGGSGGNGGNTVVTNMPGGTLTLQGGGGGGGSKSSSGSGLSPSIGFPIGQQGGYGSEYFSGFGGNGGGSIFGAAGHGSPAAGVSSPGYDADGHGAGGGGGGGVVSTSNNQGNLGGAGAPGLIVIHY